MSRWQDGNSRFWAKVAKGDECWEWTGSLSAGTGYGAFYDGRRYSTHRYSWEIHFGPIPRGLCVLHRCDNRRCVRPDHLWIGTKRENSRDMARKGRTAIHNTAGERHGESKLTDESVRAIRASSEPGIVLAARYAVTPSLVSAVRRRKAWRHI